MDEILHILHTNDLHSHFENWPKIRRYILGKQAEFETKHEFCLTLDIGDAMDRVRPLTEATNGQINTELLNEGHYDAVTIGNNEGVGNSHEVLEHLYDHAQFPVILGNLFEPNGKLAQFAIPYKIINTPQNTRVALIAFTAPFFLSYEPNDWQVKLIKDMMPKVLEKIKGQYDVLILMSHLGLTMDRQLAATYPQIDVICGGHTHHLLPDGEMVDHTLLTAAEKYGHYIGKIQLKVKDHQVVSQAARTIKTADLKELPEDEAEIEGYRIRGEGELDQQKIAELPQRMPVKLDQDFPMVKLALQAIEEYAKVDGAVLNTGLFLKDLDAGVVSRNDLHQQLPHPMHLIKVKLSGTDLWRLAMEMEKNQPFLRNFPIKGMGFRGQIFGELVYDGFAVDPIKRQVWWHGKPIDPQSSYTIVTVDHYLFIPFFPTIEIMGDVEVMFPKFIRHVVGDYLKKIFPLND